MLNVNLRILCRQAVQHRAAGGPNFTHVQRAQVRTATTNAEATERQPTLPLMHARYTLTCVLNGLCVHASRQQAGISSTSVTRAQWISLFAPEFGNPFWQAHFESMKRAVAWISALEDIMNAVDPLGTGCLRLQDLLDSCLYVIAHNHLSPTLCDSVSSWPLLSASGPWITCIGATVWPVRVCVHAENTPRSSCHDFNTSCKCLFPNLSWSSMGEQAWLTTS